MDTSNLGHFVVKGGGRVKVTTAKRHRAITTFCRGVLWIDNLQLHTRTKLKSKQKLQRPSDINWEAEYKRVWKLFITHIT